MFKRIYFFFFTYIAAMSFSQTQLVLWFSKNGYNFSELILYALLCFLVTVLGMIFMSKKEFSSKKSMFFGVLFSSLVSLSVIKIFNPGQILLSAIFSGLNIILFWLPYNIMHFKFTHEEKRGLYSGIYFLVSPVVGLTLLPLGGVIADRFGFTVMFIIGGLLYVLPLISLFFLPDFKWRMDLDRQVIKNNFDWVLFFQGALMRLDWSFIPIFSLFFIHTPTQFGNFFGYLALVSAFGALFNGHISDKIKNRKQFFYFFSFLAVLSFIPLAFVRDIEYWYLFAGISNLSMRLANPFWLAYSLDHGGGMGLHKTMIMREFFLELGFVFSLLCGFFAFYFTSSPKITLITVSFLGLLLPIFAYFKGAYRDRM